MNLTTLTRRSLAYFWRTHAAVVLGVGTSIAVLTGALLVGDSVRGSLRGLVELRLGETDQVILSTGYFRETLARGLEANPGFPPRFDTAAPLILTQGFVRTQIGDAQAGPVRVYGVDDRFWSFHGRSDVTGPEGRAARISPALADALDVEEGDTILVRLQRPTDMPIESVYGEKDDLGQTVRANIETILSRDSLGEFSLEPTQGDVQTVFLPLALLQDELEVTDRANAILIAGGTDEASTAALEDLVRQEAAPADLGLDVRLFDSGWAALESDSGLLADTVATQARALGETLNLDIRPVFTWLATSIRSGTGEIPYGLVTATDLGALAPEITLPPDAALPPIILNEAAAADLSAVPGATVSLEYFIWQDPGRLATSTAEFRLAGVVPIDRGDRDLAPDYPGISESPDLADWDPPFPVDLGRIRPRDEDYWDSYRTTPRGFVPLGTGQALWGSRHGNLTSLRFRSDSETLPEVAEDLEAGLAERIDPLEAGLTVAGVRASGIESSRGAVNFGEYFVYFSFFLVASALLLAALFFKLSVEQRVREVGLLRAVGYTPARVRALFMKEGLWLSLAGALVGALGGVGYAWLVIRALGTWWIGAVGTSHLTLNVTPVSILLGITGGIIAALLCIRITLGGLKRISERRLLAGQLGTEAGPAEGTRAGRLALASALLGVGLVGITLAGGIPQAGGFFGAGALFLIACLSLFLYLTRRPSLHVLDGRGLWPLTRFGVRNVTWRPARSIASVAMIASAAFILVSVDAFRTGTIGETGPDTGIGGYDLIVETLLPVVEDPDSEAGRAVMGVDPWASIGVEPFRYRPGEDASCLNLYAPRNPRIIGARQDFIEAGRFRFSDSLASTPEEEANPWRLLDRDFEDGAIPVVADKHSITYVLGRSLGDDIVITEGEHEIRLRLVAALDDSIFQGELVMSETRFRDLFPHLSGYAWFLVETGDVDSGEVRATMSDALADHGAVLTGTLDRLAAFHQVENTYLSTFQALGALGLLLGTVGLAAILLRNVLERRQELALLRALGYPRSAFTTMALAENTLLLVGGLLSGVLCALLAIGPAVAERGGRLPGGLLLLLLIGVLALGLITSLGATLIALRSPLLAALRSE